MMVTARTKKPLAPKLGRDFADLLKHHAHLSATKRGQRKVVTV